MVRDIFMTVLYLLFTLLLMFPPFEDILRLSAYVLHDGTFGLLLMSSHNKSWVSDYDPSLPDPRVWAFGKL